MVEKMDFMDKNEAWKLVELSDGRKPISRKWMFKKDLIAKGKIQKHKSHLVTKGFFHVVGIISSDDIFFMSLNQFLLDLFCILMLHFTLK